MTACPTTSYPLQQLYVYLTEGCNLRCRHCWLAPAYQGTGNPGNVLDPELFSNILAQGKKLGLTSVKFTGGEPLMHPEFPAILEMTRQHELHITIETNGVLCTPELAQAIKTSTKRPFVSVSIDGPDAPTHEWVRGVKGSFDAALQGIANLVEAGIRPQIIMTIMRKNSDMIEELVALAQKIGASSVKFNIVQPTERGKELHKNNETLSIKELIELGHWVEKTLQKTTKLPLHYSLPIAFRPLSSMFGQGGSGCSRCGIFSILGILPNGSYALCGIGESVPELVFGHAAKDDLKTVWEQHPVLNELRDGMPHKLEGVCSQCIHKNFCLASCIAQNYYKAQSLWAPFWFCDQAYTEQLFPENRLTP